MITPHIVLPCKPRVLQYLRNKYPSTPIAAGIAHPAHMIVELPDRDPYLLLMYALLTKNLADHDASCTLQHYTAQVRIPIHYRYYEDHGLELTRSSIVTINNRIEDVIDDQLDMILNFYTSIRFPLQDAIEIFRRAYNFPEESYSSDAIQKRWQRYTKKTISVHNIIAQTVLSGSFNKIS